jgi:hypothetical protein
MMNKTIFRKLLMLCSFSQVTTGMLGYEDIILTLNWDHHKDLPSKLLINSQRDDTLVFYYKIRQALRYLTVPSDSDL